MPLRMVVEGKFIGESVFEAEMDASDVRRLGLEMAAEGGVSVLVLDGETTRSENGRLEFDLGAARVLQVGDSRRTFFILDHLDGSPRRQADPKKASGSDGSLTVVRALSGDDQFVSRLPRDLRPTGEKLIEEVRRVYPGKLVYHETSQRYVESPDNFWTVRIQPRVRDLEITVRGYHWEFSAPNGFEIKPLRGSHSKFKISRPEQVEGALRILKQARKR